MYYLLKKFIFMKQLKKILVLLGSGAFIALVMINIKIGYTIYNEISSSLLTLEAMSSESSGGSCLQAGSPVKGGKKTSSANSNCYQYRQGPDYYSGSVVECEARNSSSTWCTSFTCSGGSGCYTSSQKPTSDNT
jgi:hypothetical protein